MRSAELDAPLPPARPVASESRHGGEVVAEGAERARLPREWARSWDDTAAVRRARRRMRLEVDERVPLVIEIERGREY